MWVQTRTDALTSSYKHFFFLAAHTMLMLSRPDLKAFCSNINSSLAASPETHSLNLTGRLGNSHQRIIQVHELQRVRQFPGDCPVLGFFCVCVF